MVAWLPYGKCVRGPPLEPAFCTIFPRGEAAAAHALFLSVKRHRPHARFYACATDMNDRDVDPSPWKTVPATALASRRLPVLRRKCSESELSQVLLPMLLSHVLEHERAVVYFEPTTMVFDAMRDLDAQLEEAPILMVPYAQRPRVAREAVDEIGLIAEGAYNDGFLGLRRSPAASAFLEWWGSRVLGAATRLPQPSPRPIRGRSWWDLAPCYFETLRVLRDPRYGATALDGTRGLEMKDGRLYAGKVRSHFFQFTPNVDAPSALRSLYRSYRAALRGRGPE